MEKCMEGEEKWLWKEKMKRRGCIVMWKGYGAVKRYFLIHCVLLADPVGGYINGICNMSRGYINE